ncbi:hypothetical protein ABZ341_17120 [Streptomyces sp. NPDC006173]|uniref:hypothetical protein n=1 Tax=Streptomyces sp. NPDC006173 TaxID=3155349 RepID=UPI0033D9F5B2
MPKPRLSPQEHADLGRALAALRDELAHRVTQLKNAYPHAGRDGTPGRRLAAAVHAIDNARNDLDNALFREHPDVAETTAYYPHSEDRGWRPQGRGAGAIAVGRVSVGRCPQCRAPSYYARELDRYIHEDGSANHACWLAINRGWALRSVGVPR